MWNLAEERTRKLLKLAPKRDFLNIWQKNVHHTIRNMVLGGRGHFPLAIDSFDELEKVIKSWQALGLSVRPGGVLSSIIKHLRRNKKNPDKHIGIYARVAEILGPYAFRDPQLRRFIAFDESYWLDKYDKQTLRAEIIKRANRERRLVDGWHTRDHRLARLLKSYYKFTCIACGRNESKDLLIQVSHKIHLNLGFVNGGIDNPINMETLCEECHERYEAQFEREYGSIDESERPLWLRKKQHIMLENSEWSGLVDVPDWWGTEFKKNDSGNRPSGSRKKQRFLIFCVDCKNRYRRPLVHCPRCGGMMQRYVSKVKRRK